MPHRNARRLWKAQMFGTPMIREPPRRSLRETWWLIQKSSLTCSSTWFAMKRSTLIGAVLLGVVLCVTLTHASDPTAVYTRIERVVLEPNAEAPQAIQVWGVFAMAKPDDRNDYLPPKRGYLYFTFNGTSPAVSGNRCVVSSR